MTDDDRFPDFDFDDEDLEEFLDAWDAADTEARDLLRETCTEVLAASPPQPELTDSVERLRAGAEVGHWPFDYFVAACGWPDTMPADDTEMWEQAAAATISPPDDPGTPAEEQSAVAALLHADWFGMVVGLVRRGVGARVTGGLAARDIAECPEIDDESEDPDEDAALVASAVAVLTPLWRAVGIIDEDDRLTALGSWGLPRALDSVWTVSESH